MTDEQGGPGQPAGPPPSSPPPPPQQNWTPPPGGAPDPGQQGYGQQQSYGQQYGYGQQQQGYGNMPSFWVNLMGQQQGPYAFMDLQGMAKAGQLRASTLVARAD